MFATGLMIQVNVSIVTINSTLYLLCLSSFQAMTGFLLITTREGKLLYISDNVTEYLGHSMVNITLLVNDTLYTIIFTINGIHNVILVSITSWK